MRDQFAVDAEAVVEGHDTAIGCPASGEIFVARPGDSSAATASIGRGHSSDARLSERACSPREDGRRRRLPGRRGLLPGSRRSRTSGVSPSGDGSRVRLALPAAFPSTTPPRLFDQMAARRPSQRSHGSTRRRRAPLATRLAHDIEISQAFAGAHEIGPAAAT